jgi:acetoin utilization deacetylase AcuC-like enzyme
LLAARVALERGACPHLGGGFHHAYPDHGEGLAGADPYRMDQLGGLALTQEGLRARDRMVLEACRRHGVPVAVVLAGGYALDTRDTVAIHTATVIETLGAGVPRSGQARPSDPETRP